MRHFQRQALTAAIVGAFAPDPDRASMGVIERLTALEDKVFGGGPVAPTGQQGEDQSGMMPGQPVSAVGQYKGDMTNVTPLPWNEQSGDGGKQLFRGPTSIPLVPLPVKGRPFTGFREVSISQVPPQFERIGIKLDNDADFLPGSTLRGINSTALFRVYFENGQPRVMHLTPNPDENGNYQQPGPREPVPCGHVQFVGGGHSIDEMNRMDGGR